MGTPGFAVPTLQELSSNGYDLVCVYSQPPRKSGRGMKKQLSPVHQCAQRLALPVRTPVSLRKQNEINEFTGLPADVAIVVAYGLILPEEILRAPRLGCLNLHASLLPRWRGAAPLQRAIMAGDPVTGVCTMRMERELDTGPVCLAEKVELPFGLTAGELHDRLASQGAQLMVRTLKLLEAGKLDCKPQEKTGATYASKISKDEAQIDFAQPALKVAAHIHGLAPVPGAWTSTQLDGKMVRLKILRVEMVDAAGQPGEVLDERLTIGCSQGALRPVLMQREGKKAIPLAEFQRGTPVKRGQVLGRNNPK